MRTLATFLALAAASAFAAPEVDIMLRPFVPRSAPTNEVRVAVDVRPGNRMPLVECTVDGRPATMIFDTGASHTTLDVGFVARELLGRALQKVAMVGSTNVERQPSLVHAASLNVGEAEFADFDLMALDLSHLRKSVGARVDGIIGMNVIGRTMTLVSLGSGEVVFAPVRTRLAGFEKPVDRVRQAAFGGRPDPFSIDIDAEYNGRRLPLFVDSASSITVVEQASAWPAADKEVEIDAADVNSGGNGVKSRRGEPGEIMAGVPLRLEPEVVPDGVLYRDGRGRIGADTLLRYDMLVGASRVAFRPCAKKGDAK